MIEYLTPFLTELQRSDSRGLACRQLFDQTGLEDEGLVVVQDAGSRPLTLPGVGGRRGSCGGCCCCGCGGGGGGGSNVRGHGGHEGGNQCGQLDTVGRILELLELQQIGNRNGLPRLPRTLIMLFHYISGWKRRLGYSNTKIYLN